MDSKRFLPTRPDKRAREAGLHWEDGDFAERFPACYALLAAAKDGVDPREGATLLVFAEGGSLKVCVNDRATGQSMWLTLQNAEDIWREVDTYIQAHPNAWRERMVPKSRR